MLTMKQLNWNSLKIGQKKQIVLTEPLLACDTFGDKHSKVIPAGETITMWHSRNFGAVIHKVHGVFRY